MTAGETANLWGSLLALAGSGTFITAYALLVRRWWSSPVGRLLMVKAVTIAVLMAITVCIYLVDDRDVYRWVRGVFAGVFGLAMLGQAVLVARMQIAGARRGAGSAETEE